MKRILLAVVVSTAILPWVPAQSLPTGFADETLASGFVLPIGMGFLPDGRLIICEQQTHIIKVFANGVVGTLGTVPDVDNGIIENERGLQHVAIDPGWPARPYLYVFFTHTAPHNCWLSMYTVTGDLTNPTSTNLTLGAQYNIITDIPDNSENHNGSSLRFGPDGKLYLSSGEDYQGCPAQNPSSGLGCILRVDVSSLPGVGSGPPPKTQIAPAGNPITVGTGTERLMWSYGLRNPWRFHIDSVSGNLFIGDVGESTWEELDWATTGGLNFGWPWKEANAAHATCTGSQPATTAPVVAYNHTANWFAIESMLTYRNRAGGVFNFGNNYEGDWFYNDYISGTIRRLRYNGTSWVAPTAAPGQPDANNWATGITTMSDSVVGPDGAIYWLKHTAGQLHRIKATANQPILTVQPGSAQPVNAGWTAQSPLAVRLATPGGSPLANTPVTFTVTAGGGTVGAQPVLTDANGIASTTFTASTTNATNPVVTASSTYSSPVPINLVWRGLQATYIAPTSTLAMTVRHSQTNSPITIVADVPVASPYFVLPFGAIWTSVLAPLPTLVALDGLGLVGPPNPAIVTGAVNPTYSVTFPGLPPLGGLTIKFQAYGIDTNLYPQNSSYFLSQPVTLTLN